PVTASDPYGNTDPSYGATVHFSSSDGSAALPDNSTLTGGTGGFDATLNTAGVQSITATQVGNATINGTQAGITVASTTGTTHLTISGSPNETTADAPFSFTVTAKDTNGNTVTGYTGIVHFTLGT